MIILPAQQAVFVGVPRAASKAVSQWLERSLRPQGGALHPAEAMHCYHASIPEAVAAYGLPLHAYWSFAVVRNPFDRLVSHCAMFDTDFVNNPQHSLYKALNAPPTRWTMPQHALLDGVGSVFRFEQLDAAVVAIGERLGIDASTFLQEHQSEHGPYRDYYTPALRELVELRYAADLLVYNYGF